MAKVKERDENDAVRTWPGIVLLVTVAVVICAGIYLFGYKTGYLPMPSYLERFFHLQDHAAGHTDNDGLFRAFYQSLPVETETAAGMETETERFFDPAPSEAEALFTSLNTPTKYHQRMRIMEQSSVNSEARYHSVTLYVNGSLARIESDDDIIIYDMDSGHCFRGDRSGGVITAVGNHTPFTEIGLPMLSEIQVRNDLSLTFSPENKSITAVYTTETVDWKMVYAVDSGLLTEMQIERDGVRIFNMYTEQYTLYPEFAADLFRIPVQDNQ